MNQADREKRHHRNVDRISQVQLVVGRGDHAHVDHEGTVLERARLLAEELRSHTATEQGLDAFDRLLRLVEDGRSRQARWVAEFILAVWDDKPVRLSMLRGMPATIGDDVIAVLDGLRYARLDLAEHVAGGAGRVVKVLEKCE